MEERNEGGKEGWMLRGQRRGRVREGLKVEYEKEKEERDREGEKQRKGMREEMDAKGKG